MKVVRHRRRLLLRALIHHGFIFSAKVLQQIVRLPQIDCKQVVPTDDRFPAPR
jgi:hypothetical protein